MFFLPGFPLGLRVTLVAARSAGPAARTGLGAHSREWSPITRAALEPIRHAGNQRLFRALELSILSTLVGLPFHVHAEGLRGTGKTTIIRAFRRRLPRIERIKDCVYNCLPAAPHCPEHRDLSAEEIRAIGTEWVPMPFREISHSAKIGTVVGSIDLARMTGRDPEAAILPGTIAQANRGIVFVDEINRLADTAPELVDVLLDVMGTKPGRLQIEETGLPCVEITSSVSVWAASNPDEDPGPLEDIRKQLSDRFDLVITMERPTAVSDVKEIIRSSSERLWRQAALLLPTGPGGGVSGGPEVFAEGSDEEHGGGPEVPEWEGLRRALGSVEFPGSVEEVIASLYVDFGLESLRAIEAIHHGARVHCVLENRRAVALADVLAVAPGALQHRVDVSTFARVMDYLTEKLSASPEREAAGRRKVPEPGTVAANDETRRASGPGDREEGEEAVAGLRTQEEPVASTQTPGGGDGGHAVKGWSFVRSLLGMGRARTAHGGREGGTGPEGAAGSRDALVQGGDRGAGASPEASVCHSAGRPAPHSAEDAVVAPPSRARPLAEILLEMESSTCAPPGPRPY
ncbi:MAG TPA: magnesium chelatase [Clostridiales bacterium]|nr:magnesium chelatase [Clostridiales bacterium]